MMTNLKPWELTLTQGLKRYRWPIIAAWQIGTLSSKVNMHNIEVTVTTHFMASHSDENQSEFAFSYTITISNHSTAPVQLLKRAWKITDADHKIGRASCRERV